MSADELVAALGLQPHPEGGWYVETFRDRALDADGRGRSSAIYHLLERGQVSARHCVDAAEVA
jgi:predicted cupin superfamily sugar epimerase